MNNNISTWSRAAGRIFTIAVVLILFHSCNQAENFKTQSGDILYYNGNVITVDEDFSIVSQLVIRDENIVYTGNSLSKENYPDANKVNLKGQTIMPGLIEPHTHPIAAAVLNNWIDVSGFTHESAEDALGVLRAAAQHVPEGQWILAFGWDAMLLKGSFAPYREVLDEISDKHPIWVMMQSMHSHYFNSYALELAGINDDIKNPPQGGIYEKDDNGRLTGLITESVTLAPFLPTLPALSPEMQLGIIKNQYAQYNAAGITSIGILGLIDGLMPKAEEHLQYLSKQEKKNLRVFLYRDGATHGHLPLPTTDNEYFKYLGNKYWADGSPYTGTMLMKEPYIVSELNNDKLSIKKGSFGETILSKEQYESLTQRDAAAQIQIAIHAQGDSATQNAIALLKNVLKANPTEDHRHRLEHLALVQESHIREMAELGITPSFHINHIYYYGDFLARIVGAERASSFMPIGLAKKYGLKFSLHNDSPMYPPRPLLNIESAVSRNTLNGRPLGPEYAISVEEAIKAVTIYPAWQMYAEDRIGSLEVGKKADFVILDRNPLEVSVEEISELKIEKVFISGHQVKL